MSARGRRGGDPPADDADDFLERPAAELAAPLFAGDADEAATAADDAALLQELRAALGDRYQVEAELGRGGMATVFAARDIRHGRRVALKVLHRELATAAGSSRFRREIETIAGLSHPHIVPLHDSGEAAGLPYFVLPFVEGESLRDRLAREGRLAIPAAVALCSELAGALAYAHARGVVHRDVKPENILLSDGHALLADFGIARVGGGASGATTLTATGLALGTPAYMSPEQAAGEREIDARSDIYSLGCVLYEMLAGAAPFAAPSIRASIARRLNEAAPSVRAVRPEVPAALDAVVARATAPAPEDRYQSAAAMADALAQATTSGTPGPSPSHTARRRGAGVAIALGIAALAGATAWLATRRPAAPVDPAAEVIAILPLTSAAPDTGLARLGRELVVTLSANLGGVDDIRTTDAATVLASVGTATGAAPLPLSDALALAARLGARSALAGTLVRRGDSVRADVALYLTAGGEPLARASATARADDITALTDSATWALLRAIWRSEGPPTPSLASVTTRSIPAMRAFLEGEREVSEGRWRAAARSFERAFTEDSTFWLAYWRYALARDYWSAPVDSAIRTKYREHRGHFPERDSLLIESGMTDSLSVRIDRTRRVAERYPDYWPAWWALSERLAHDAPLLGTTSRDLRPVLERTLTLNPAMAPAWQHLFWVAMWERDTALSRRVLDTLTRLRYDSLSRAESAFDELAHFRYLDALARRDGELRDRTLAEPGVRAMASVTGPVPPLAVALANTFYGFPQEQVLFSREVLAAGASPAMAAGQHLAIAIAQASRGAWDSALVALDAFVAAVPGPAAPLYRYRVAVIAAWLGALPPSSAERHREPVTREAAELPPASRSELAWLDGMLAVARRDTSALGAARRALRAARTTDTVTAPMLERSLAAFGAELAGDRRRAAESLAALERERAESGAARYASDAHPFLTAVNRLAAARWLHDAGDVAAAAPLLAWHEAVLAPQWATRHANAMVEGIAYLERARSAAALERHDLADDYRRRFLRRYDAPTPSHRHLVDEARRALSEERPGRRR